MGWDWSKDPNKVRTILETLGTLATVVITGFAASGIEGAYAALFTAEVGSLVLGAIGVILGIQGLAGVLERKHAFKPDSAQDLAETDFSAGVGAFAKDIVKGLLPQSKVASGLLAVVDIVHQYGHFALTDDVKQRVTREIHSALRSTGLVSGRDFPAI